VTFPSLTFAVFFVAVMLVHRAPLAFTTRKAVLLVASHLFYAAWNPPFVVLLWISTAVDWVLAKKIHDEKHESKRRGLLALSLVANLSMLGFFKYGTFLSTNFTEVLSTLGVDVTFAPPSVLLPVGISFYTFQTLSYTIDVYRRRLTPSSSLLDYALFVSFFPQLVAGPIVRARDFLPQLENEHRASRDEVGFGLSLLALGLFQKAVLADAFFAPVVEQVYGERGAITASDAWTGTLAFAGQIFCDFAGYSTCAIGTALALGFVLPDNFRAPYAAVGFSDFWRRWHVSLSSWLRDYLYIPLGGSGMGAVRTALALVVTMLLGGLWHGAAWTFVVWGALHGLFLVAEHGLRALTRGRVVLMAPAVRMVFALVTFALVVIAWVPFRADDLAHTRVLWSTMFGITQTDVGALLEPYQHQTVLVLIGALVVTHHALRDHTLGALAARVPVVMRPLVVALLLLALVFSPGPQNDFIYFQF
jgi:alginate O-acetyltransferase complex protein AlgI